MAETHSNSTAIVTGGASGIGAAAARRLAGRGVHVIVADQNGEAAADIAETLGATALAFELDVADELAVERLFASLDALPPVTTLVNAAGIGSTTNAVDTSLDTWERVFAVNSRGTFLCCKHALQKMRPAQRGSIVNVASIAGQVGLRDRAAYCASKGAVIALTRALAVDHVRDGIRVNCVCPGTVESPWVARLIEDAGESLEALRARQPMGRLGTPDEIAEAIAYLASDQAAFVTGSALVIDGGLTAA